MRLSNKHQGVQMVSFSDFTGGLNTTEAPETIEANELTRAVNVEIYNGQLKTVSGTDLVFQDLTKDFASIIYDGINELFLLVDTASKVYSLSDGTLTELGELSGTSDVQYATWEDGVIIASGGQLQYYHGGALETLTGSPSVCHGVFIKNGRVWTYYDDELHTSAVGDETNWTNDSNDSSSAQWLQIGYKDGGYITGVCSLSSDVLVFKSNHHAYHLAGSFPDWTLSEIGRQIECKDYNDCVALANASLTLGRTSVQAITTTDSYGDMRATEVSAKVAYDIANMSGIKLRYMPSLNQVWFINGEKIFMFIDLNNNGFFRREYTSPLADAVEANGSIYLLKNHGVYVLNGQHMTDENTSLFWKYQTKTLVSNNAYLIKRVRVDITPYYRNYAQAGFKVGKVVVDAPIPSGALSIYHDYTTLYHSKRSLYNKKSTALWAVSDEIYGNNEYIYQNPEPLYHTGMYRRHLRCVDRERAIRVYAHGGGGMTVFNGISFEIAEV